MRLVFLDLETTGLDPKRDQILEVGAVLVSEDLTPGRAFHALPDSGAPMSDFVRDMHTKSGLLARREKGTEPLSEVSTRLCAWLEAHGLERGQVILTGDSVHFDRAFVREHLPEVFAWLHHRQVDVSTLRVLYTGWCDETWPDKWKVQNGDTAHRAVDDCLSSLARLRWFRERLFRT